MVSALTVLHAPLSAQVRVRNKFSKVMTDELIQPLFTSLHAYFHLCSSPENFAKDEESVSQLVVIGASMKRAAKLLLF
jgi:hypothetical protein